VAQVVVFLALLFSILIAVFAVQNTTTVSVSFLIWGPATVAVSVLVLISAALGALAMLLLGIGREVRLRWPQRQIAAQLRTAQARVAELEASPSAAPKAAVEPVPLPESEPAREPTL
jgi:uncharacterized integral membrane protein